MELEEKRLDSAEIDLKKINKTIPFGKGGLLSKDISLLEYDIKLLELLREEITEQHNEAIDLVTVFVEQEDGIDLGDIKLSFEESDENFLARAYRSENKIEYNLLAVFKPRVRATAIHELAHIICNHYISKKIAHTLEFAIINYCILYKNNYQNTDFFRSYDIHEDIAYRFLSINPFEFDGFITCINWNSIKELVEKAKNLAEVIRRRAIPHNLY